jgi:hypothetical protein
MTDCASFLFSKPKIASMNRQRPFKGTNTGREWVNCRDNAVFRFEGGQDESENTSARIPVSDMDFEFVSGEGVIPQRLFFSGDKLVFHRSRGR